MKAALAVYRKEMLDLLRDHRTLAAIILMPIALYPAMGVVLFQALQVERGQRQAEQYVIVVPDEAHREWVGDLLEHWTDVQVENERRIVVAEVRASQFTLQVVPGELADEVRAGRASLALVAQPHVPGSFVPLGETVKVQLFYDQAVPKSEAAMQAFVTRLRDAKTELLSRRLASLDIDDSALEPLVVERESVASPQKLGGAILGILLPYFLVMMTITGAIYPAVDLTVGERERGTLETLMTSPVTNNSIMAGKFLACTTLAVLSALFNLLSLLATAMVGMRLAGDVPESLQQFSLPLSIVPSILLLTLPLAMLFSALLLATCSFARTLKEAQVYITPVLCLALLPPILVLSPAVQLEGAMLVLPVANVMVLLREMFVGNYDWTKISMVFGSTSLYAAAAVILAARLFGTEAVLFSDAGSYRTLLLRKYYRPSPVPHSASALVLVACVFPLFFNFQLWMAGTEPSFASLRWTTIGTMVGCLLLPPLLAAWYFKHRFVDTFSLRIPSSGGWLATLLLAFGMPLAGLTAGPWIEQSVQLPEESRREMQKLAEWMLAFPLWEMVFLFAILPALCEEMLFRGWLQSGLRNQLPPVVLCVTVGVIFGLFHIDLVRVPVTATMGVILAAACLRTGSILPAMIIHGINNATVLLAARWWGESATLPPVWSGIGIASLLVGLIVLARLPGTTDPELAQALSVSSRKTTPDNNGDGVTI